MAGPVSLSSLPNLSIQSETRPGARIASALAQAGNQAGKAGGVHGSFTNFLEAQINDVNQLQVEADQAVTAMATGRSHNLHEMMLALDRADVSFRLMTKVRNKAVEAYQEIMRLQF